MTLGVIGEYLGRIFNETKGGRSTSSAATRRADAHGAQLLPAE